MIFVEINTSEELGALEKRFLEVLTSFNEDDLAHVRFGEAIVWRGRRFQRVEFPAGHRALEYENLFFEAVGWQVDRAMLMVGSLRSGAFTTPPQDGEEPVADFKEGGRCAPRRMVRPFVLSDYEADAEGGR